MSATTCRSLAPYRLPGKDLMLYIRCERQHGHYPASKHNNRRGKSWTDDELSLAFDPWVQSLADYVNRVSPGLALDHIQMPPLLRQIIEAAVRERVITEQEIERKVGDIVQIHLNTPVPRGFVQCNGETYYAEDSIDAPFWEVLEGDDETQRSIVNLMKTDGPNWVWPDDNIASFMWTGDVSMVAFPDQQGDSCKSFVCGNLDPGTGGKWWIRYGCCSKECVIEYYGPEVNGGDPDDV